MELLAASSNDVHTAPTMTLKTGHQHVDTGMHAGRLRYLDLFSSQTLEPFACMHMYLHFALGIWRKVLQHVYKHKHSVVKTLAARGGCMTTVSAATTGTYKMAVLPDI